MYLVRLVSEAEANLPLPVYEMGAQRLEARVIELLKYLLGMLVVDAREVFGDVHEQDVAVGSVLSEVPGHVVLHVLDGVEGAAPLHVGVVVRDEGGHHGGHQCVLAI